MAKTARLRITCDKETFEKVRQDGKFPHIVALARAVNALTSVHSLLPPTTRTPKLIRNRINSFLFASALLYEGLRLIRAMHNEFRDDVTFQNGLHMLLKNPTARKLERSHLNPARNHAVFHFLPDKFEGAIRRAVVDDCIFVDSQGKKVGAIHYQYADVVAMEMLVGEPSDQPAFWPRFERASGETGQLLIKFANDAEDLIGSYLKAWGFKRE